MHKYLRLMVVLFIFAAPLYGDDIAVAQANLPQARKFDEFGDILITEIKARLDNYVIELQSEPNTRGFIIVYRSRRDLEGLSGRLLNRMKTYLVYSRGIPSERLVAVDGGAALCVTQELWIVPAGAAPAPRRDAYSRTYADTETVRKFDEYIHFLPEDMAAEMDGLDDGASLEAFTSALRQEPRALAYIVVYPRYYVERREQYRDERRTGTQRVVHLDAPGTSAKVMRALKAELSGKYRIAPSRIRTMDGGYRRWREVELWIVPRGQHAPVPTPDAFPPQRKRRR